MNGIITNGKTIQYDNISWYPNGQGYYFCTKNGKYQTKLHRYIWEKYNTTIPEDCHIHHTDGDKNNNSIENLVCMSSHDHYILHSSLKKKKEIYKKYSNTCKYCKNIYQTNKKVQLYCSQLCERSSRKGSNYKNKNKKVLYIKTGEIYISIEEAAKEKKYANKYSISQACKKMKIWKYI